MHPGPSSGSGVTTAFRLDESEVAQAAGWARARFAALGLHAGDVVALPAEPGAAYVGARDAAAAVGLIVMPINPRLAPPQIAERLAAANAQLISLPFVDELAAQTRSLPRPSEVGATILFTSGTTGQPKACLRSEAQESARANELMATYSITRSDVHLIACPLAHSAPGIFLRAARRVGATTVFLPRFDARAFLDAVQTCKASIFFLVPTQVERLLALGLIGTKSELPALPSVRAFIVAGAPFAPATKRRLLDWIGPGKLWEFYGSSETGTISVVPPAAQPGAAGFVGWPAAGVQIQILDDAGQPVEPGVEGEIFVRAPTVMTGYLGQQARASRLPGFISVGDIGRREADGSLVLVDRKGDLVITGGVNVYPAEVERALVAHPRVTGAVVCGVPHPDWGEELCALVAGSVTADDEAELREFLRARLASYQIPKRLVIVDAADLPLGESGKPLRRAARARFPTLWPTSRG